MKAEHRHELQTNVLADWISNSADKVKPYTSIITIVCIGVAIGIGIIAYIRSMERRSQTEAAEQLVSALQGGGPGELQAMIADYKGTEPATVAQLLLAEQQLDAGADTLFSNKPAARENLSKAAESFALAKDQSQDPMLRAWAIYGLARAHESMGELDRARADYQLLRKDYPDGALADPARKALDRLERPSVKEFYDWFAKQDPRPPAADASSGIPGMKPSFDFKEPGGMGDVKLPTASDPNSPLLPSATPDTPLPSTTPPLDAPATSPPADSDKPADAPK